MKRRRSLPWPLILLAAITVLSMGAGMIAFGPQRALRIAGAAVLGTLADGLAERPSEHRIPLVEIEVEQSALDSLNSDLPWSGGDPKKAVLLKNGIRYPATYRYRGLVASTHYLGGKKSFRLNLKKDNPFAPYRRVNFINPKTNNLLNTHLAYWIAAYMGVAVPYDEPVFVRLNGRDHGVHELFEQIDGAFERNRHLVDHEVPVFKGDYPPATGREWPNWKPLWASAKNWAYESDADSTQAKQKLEALIAVINAPAMDDHARIDSLGALIDIDAFVRYYAALKVQHNAHADNYHNQRLVLSPRSGKFYPVLWDPLLLFAKRDPFHPIHDALAFWLMRDPDLRLQRDRYIHVALKALEGDSLFDRQLTALEERILPSVLADRNKHGQVTEEAQDILRFSAVHWAGSCARLRSGLHTYWKMQLARMQVDSLVVKQEGDMLIATWSGDAVIGYHLRTDTLAAIPREGEVFLLELEDPATGLRSYEVEPVYRATHSMGTKPDPFKDGQYWDTPNTLRIQLHGTDPSRVSFFNLITYEPVEAQR